MSSHAVTELRCPGCGYGLYPGHGVHCPECGGLTDGAAFIADQRRRQRRRTILAVALLLAVSYVPYCWILFVFTQWSEQGPWLAMWPVLPGLLVAAIVQSQTQVSDPWFAVIAGTTTLALLVGGIALARRGPVWMAVTVVLLLGLNLFQSWAAYQLSLM